jgi:hypothetical protein
MKFEWDFSEFNVFAERLMDLSKFDLFAQQATREIANALREALFRNTPVLTGNLSASWGGEENYNFTLKKLSTGYSVTLYNRAANKDNFKYGLAVNDGHYSKNQYGGPYKWVVGRFFVEKSIIQTAESTQLESIIMRELEKWWRSV